MGRVEFSVGIPVWNEEGLLVPNLARLCSHLEGLGDYEILIVNNGSTDRTGELARGLTAENPRIRYFEIGARDVAGAFRLMLSEARSDSLVSLDMDLSSDLSFVDQALDLLSSHIMVVGSKKLGEQKRSWVRRLGSDLYVRCARQFLGLGVEDYSMGAKAYHVPFFRPLCDRISSGTSYVVSCVYLARTGGGSIIETPVWCEDFRQSSFNLPREAIHKFSHLARLWLQHRRTRRRAGPSS